MTDVNEYTEALQFAEEYFERCRQIQIMANRQAFVEVPLDKGESEDVRKDEVIVLDDDDDRIVSINLEDENDIDITSVGVLKEWIDISELDLSKHIRYTEEKKTDKIDNNWADLNVEEDVRAGADSNVSEEKKADSSDEKFKCEYCPYKTNWKNNLTKHVISRHLPKEKIDWFECAHCSYKGKTREYLITHLKLHHIIRWINCPLCPMKFKTKQSLQKHELTHNVDRELFECTLCGVKLKSKKSLKDHAYLVHTREDAIKWFKCDKCKYKGKTKKHLKLHTYNRHASLEELQWFNCEHCNYQATTRKALRKHVRGAHERKKGMKEVVYHRYSKFEVEEHPIDYKKAL